MATSINQNIKKKRIVKPKNNVNVKEKNTNKKGKMLA